MRCQFFSLIVCLCFVLWFYGLIIFSLWSFYLFKCHAFRCILAIIAWGLSSIAVFFSIKKRNKTETHKASQWLARFYIFWGSGTCERRDGAVICWLKMSFLEFLSRGLQVRILQGEPFPRHLFVPFYKLHHHFVVAVLLNNWNTSDE